MRAKEEKTTKRITLLDFLSQKLMAEKGVKPTRTHSPLLKGPYVVRSVLVIVPPHPHSFFFYSICILYVIFVLYDVQIYVYFKFYFMVYVTE